MQSNKVRVAVKLFDYIHSLDSQKLADILSKSQKDIRSRNLNYFIQVNIGNEPQKSGVQPIEVDDFYTYCSKEKKIKYYWFDGHFYPKTEKNVERYFKSLSRLNLSLGLKELSMGMSDYLKHYSGI